MVELWHQSEEAPDMGRPNVRVITKSDFLALSEEDCGELLDDFIIIKDTNVSSKFFPQLALIFAHCVVCLTNIL